MERMLESPRAQRRALAAGIAVLAIGTAVFVVAFFGDKAEPRPQANPNVPAQTAKPQIAVDLDPQLRELAKTFIDTAVARKNLKAAFAITHADLKGSLTLKQWETGNIPIVPYPGADRAQVRYKVDYSPSTLNPRTCPCSSTRSITASCAVARMKPGASRNCTSR